MKHNKFSKFIERILICLPLIFLGANILYISLNENAKDSYSGTTISAYENIEGYDNIEERYYLNINGVYVDTGYILYNVYDVKRETGTFTFQQDVSNIKELYFYTGSGIKYLRLQFTDNSYQYVQNTTSQFLGYTFSFMLVNDPYGNDTTNTTYAQYQLFYREYNTYAYLNNALTYSMNEFNNLGFGKIDFVGWFVNIFMNNQYNNVYVTFVNSYLNYFLFVECCYFIPMVFYWFIHFGERLVDRFTGKTESW